MDFVSHLKKITSNEKKNSRQKAMDLITRLKNTALNKNVVVSIWGTASG